VKNYFKHGFSAKEILIKSSHKGGSDDVEAPSSSFYKIRWELKHLYRKFLPFYGGK